MHPEELMLDDDPYGDMMVPQSQSEGNIHAQPSSEQTNALFRSEGVLKVAITAKR